MSRDSGSWSATDRRELSLEVTGERRHLLEPRRKSCDHPHRSWWNCSRVGSRLEPNAGAMYLVAVTMSAMICMTLVVAPLPLDISPEDFRGVVEALGGDTPRKTEVRYEPARRLPDDRVPTRNFYKGCVQNRQDQRYVHFHCIDALPHLNGVPCNVTKFPADTSSKCCGNGNSAITCRIHTVAICIGTPHEGLLAELLG
ncbi:hypothetical protein BIW11_13611 [Tropilaelaps mercedesae]|uniref:Uncharacterized protein n=1 Tax=Tropilaelaps mercedesae TaxID=418985 RepID=A0A1V9X1C5_9ACAR|nr:hypothetical protein BIW11_13611 [Tropilaelaps mercedesae]